MSERFVLDTSVVMTWCFEDEADPFADAVLDRLAEATAVVPAIWTFEVVNVMLVAERQNRLSQEDSAVFLTLLSQLPIAVDRSWPDKLMPAWAAVGRAYQLSGYDAAYLELAGRLGVPLASLDARLRSAATDMQLPALDI